MEQLLEIRYAGVVVGHASAVRDREGDRLFVVAADPMPVGTAVELTLDGVAVSARVEAIVESLDPVASGMRLKLLGAAEGAGSAAPVAVAEADASEAVQAGDATAGGGLSEDGEEPGEPSSSGGAGNGQSAQQGGGRKRRRRRR